MAARDARRRGSAPPAPPPPAAPAKLAGPAARGLCLAGLTGVLSVTLLLPGEAAAAGVWLPLAMLALALAAGWWLAGLGSPAWPVRLAWSDAAVALLLIWQGASAVRLVWAEDGDARAAVNVAWTWLGLGALYFLTRQFASDPRTRRALAAVLAAGACGLAAFGGYQFCFAQPQLRAAYERDPEAVLREAGIVAPPGSPERKHFADRLAATEPLAAFALTNSLAGVLAPALLFGAALGLAELRRRMSREKPAPTPDPAAAEPAAAPPAPAPRRPRAAADAQPSPGPSATHVLAHFAPLAGLGLLVLATGACLLLTKSRTALAAAGLGAAVLILLTVFRGKWDWRWLAGAAGALAVLGGLVGGGLLVGGLDRQVLSEAPKSVLYRIEYWQASAGLIAERPWFGSGPGNFQQHYQRFKLPQASETVADPHNFLVEIAATAGLPACAALLAAIGLIAWELGRGNAGGEPPPDAPPGAAAPPGERWVYGGAAAGTLAAWPAGLVTGYPPDPLGVLAFAAAGGAFLVLMHPWVRDGALPRAAILLPLGALLVNLLAAGGIGFPGVAQQAWVLAALVLGTSPAGVRAWSCPRPAAAAVLLAWVGLLLLCQRSAYAPVLRANQLLAEAQQARSEDLHLRLLHEAAAADPLSPAPWAGLAAAAQQRALSEGRYADPKGVAAAEDQALRRNPFSAPLRAAFGERQLQIFARNGQAAFGRRAVEHYRRAAELAPQEALSHARLALALHWTGEPGAAAEAQRALALDAEHPHPERRLKAQRLAQPFPGGPSGDSSVGPPTIEQWMEWVRTTSR